MKEWFLILSGAVVLILMGMKGVSSINGHAHSKRLEDVSNAAQICSFEKGRFVYRNRQGDIVFKGKIILSAKMAKAKGFCQ